MGYGEHPNTQAAASHQLPNFDSSSPSGIRSGKTNAHINGFLWWCFFLPTLDVHTVPGALEKKMLSILRKARLKDKEMRILML